MSLYGFYSHAAAVKFGSAVWKTPRGSEVVITHVYNSHNIYIQNGKINTPIITWPDAVYVDKVTKCLIANTDYLFD